MANQYTKNNTGHDDSYEPPNDFEPGDPVTPIFDQFNQSARDLRVQQLADRVEQGKPLFHPLEEKRITRNDGNGRIETGRVFRKGVGEI